MIDNQHPDFGPITTIQNEKFLSASKHLSLNKGIMRTIKYERHENILQIINIPWKCQLSWCTNNVWDYKQEGTNFTC